MCNRIIELVVIQKNTIIHDLTCQTIRNNQCTNSVLGSLFRNNSHLSLVARSVGWPADYHFIERPHIPVQTTRRPCGRKFNIRVHSQFVGIIACDATFRICRTTIANLSRKWEKVPENTPPTQGFWRRYKLAHNSVSSHLSLILSGTGLCQRCC